MSLKPMLNIGTFSACELSFHFLPSFSQHAHIFLDFTIIYVQIVFPFSHLYSKLVIIWIFQTFALCKGLARCSLVSFHYTDAQKVSVWQLNIHVCISSLILG